VAKTEANLFFLQTSSAQTPTPTPDDAHNAQLQPIVDKVVALINSEQDKRATNAGNRNNCETKIDDLKSTYDNAQSLVKALQDKIAAYSEDVSYFKDSVRQLTTDLDDLETAIHKLYTKHQDNLSRLNEEHGKLAPLITTVGSVRTELLNGFATTDQVIKIVDRLENDLKHEQAQLTQEIADAGTDYTADSGDLADQKLAVLNRRGEQQGEMANARNNLKSARSDLATEQGNAQSDYDAWHVKTVECNHLLTEFNSIQQALDDHINQLRQMLGLFTNLAGLPNPQLHQSTDGAIYYSGYRVPVADEPAISTPTGDWVSNNDAAQNASPDATGTSSASNPPFDGNYANVAQPGNQ